MSSLAHELARPVRPRALLAASGPLAAVLGLLTVPPLLVALALGELAFLRPLGAAALGFLAVGMGFRRRPHPAALQRNEAMVLAAAGFVVASLAMTPALMAAGLSPHQALFEAVSAVTTTGLTTVRDLRSHPGTFLFLRAWMQWYGGLGVVVLALALLLRPGSEARALSGSDSLDLETGATAGARQVLAVYLAVTLLGTTALALVGLGAFDGLVLALAAVSTGGFAPDDASIAGLPGLAGALVVGLSVLGAMPVATLLRARREGRGEWTRDPQLAALLVLGGAVALVVALALVASGATPGEALALAGPLAFSAQSTAGFSPVDPATLGVASKLALSVSMFIGGGAGSTAGGIKLLRLLVVLQAIRVLVRRFSLPPHAVVETQVGGRRLGDEEVREALLLVLLHLAVVGVAWVPFLLAGIPPVDGLFEVISATGTVGLSVGVTSASLPPGLLGILGAAMLVGRLEVVVWLLPLDPAAWWDRGVTARHTG